MASPAPQYPQAGFAIPPQQQQYQPPSYPQYAQGMPPPGQAFAGHPPQQPGQPQIIYVMPPPGQHQQWTGQQPPPPQGYAPGPGPAPAATQEEKKKKKKKGSSSAGLVWILALAEIGVVAAIVHYIGQVSGISAGSAIGHLAAVLAICVIATIVPCFTEPNVKKRSAVPIHAGFGTLLVLWLINVALIRTTTFSYSISNYPPIQKRKGGKGGGGGSSSGSSGGGGDGSGSNPNDPARILETVASLMSVAFYISIVASVFVIVGWISQTIKWRKRVKKYQAEGWPVADGMTAPAVAKPFIQA